MAEISVGARSRRPQSRRDGTAPLPAAWIAGFLLGGIAGLGFAGWEGAMVQVGDLPFATGTWLPPVLGAYAGAGAGIGWVGGVGGLWGPRWALASAITLMGWLGAAPLAGALASLGAPPILGAVVATLGGAVAGQVAGRLGHRMWLHLGTAAFLLGGSGILAPLHLHLIGGLDLAALLLSFGLLLPALAMAGVTVALSSETTRSGLPWVPLVAWGILGGLGLGLGRLRPVVVPPDSAVADQPPVVFVVLGGVRGDRTGVGGYPRAQTPHLDALAARSLWFSSAHATSNWTIPALASILTGRMPYSHGAGLNDGRGPTHSSLRPDVPTLAGLLRQGGVATAGFSGDPQLRRYGLDTGFQAWSDAPGRGVLPILLAPLVAAGVDPVRWPTTVEAEIVTDRALAFVADQEAGGWMILVHYADASGPFQPAAEDQAAVGFTTRPFPLDEYDAAVRREDRALGRLLAEIPDDAWIVVVGDRGVHLGESRPEVRQGRVGMRFGHTMYEELTHVPLLVRGPRIGTGRVDGVVSALDVAPTVLAGLGLRPLPRADGAPLERVFGAPQADRVVIAQSSRFGQEQQAVWMGRYKLVHYADGRAPLHDLTDDPHEVTGLVGGAEAAQLERRLLGVLPPPGAGVALRSAPPVWLRLGQLGARITGTR